VQDIASAKTIVTNMQFLSPVIKPLSLLDKYQMVIG
jgi:hypothetical protein